MRAGPSFDSVRTVPVSVTLSAMMLKRLPPLMVPTETTIGSAALFMRLGIVCSALITCAATGIGSMPVCG